MQVFKVRCFKAGVWDGIEPRDVEANNEKEAAERICGGLLRDGGMIGQLRAEVYLPSSPSVKKLFYVSGQSLAGV